MDISKELPLRRTVKPVFHQKPCLLWQIRAYPTCKKVHKQHEMYVANVNQTLAYPTQTIFHWLTLRLTLGPQGLALGLQGLASALQGFSDTNMLVLAAEYIGFKLSLGMTT